MTLAELALQSDDRERADALYQEAFEGLERAGRQTRLGAVALAYSEALQQRGDLEGALTYALRAARATSGR